MKIRVRVDVEAPSGATHYFGNIMDEPTWIKRVTIAGYPNWFAFDAVRNGWYLSFQGEEAHWLKSVSETQKEVITWPST